MLSPVSAMTDNLLIMVLIILRRYMLMCCLSYIVCCEFSIVIAISYEGASVCANERLIVMNRATGMDIRVNGYVETIFTIFADSSACFWLY